MFEINRPITFDEHKQLNAGYHAQHSFNQSDYKKCLRLTAQIERSRNETTPMPGDIVEYTTEFGDYYAYAHIEGRNRNGESENRFSICEQPYVPFVTARDNGEVSMCTSGGAWTGAARNEMKYKGKRLKRFCDWGSVGACGNGAIEFIAEVNVWTLNRRNEDWKEYTTKTHRYLLVSENTRDTTSQYKYLANGNAWRNKKELDEYLEKYYAVEEAHCTGASTKKYWLCKKEDCSVFTREEFESIRAKEEKELFNGEMRPVKYIKRGSTIHCYVDRSNEDGTIKFLKENGFLKQHKGDNPLGTRGIYGFTKNGVDKITYNHFDSYPDELGKAIADFCRKTPIAELNAIYDKIVMIDSGSKPTAQQIKDCKKWYNKNVSKHSVKDWYCLLREAQGNLDAYKDGLKYMSDNSDFIEDSLFCEFGYIINLDNNTLEFWQGFQEKPQAGNRYGVQQNDGYYPCKLEKAFPLAGLPKNIIEQMNRLHKEEGFDWDAMILNGDSAQEV